MRFRLGAVVALLDQLRPDLVDKFDMRNVRALMRDGANFENAYLGHMASETVITHNVITSGQLPKDMGWSDEAFRDSDNVLGVAKDSMWITGSLTRDQFNLLIAQKGYAKLADYLHAKFPGTKFIAAGQKDYAVHTSNGPTGDISVTFSGRNFDCDGDGTNNWRGPTGLNGGAQRPVQEISIVFAGSDVGSRDSHHALRSVDILPTVLRKLGIKPGPGLDGKAVELPKR